MFVVGVDDAGRGPVVGPMVMAGIKIHIDDEKKLKDLGCKDSKLLTREKRDAMFEEIKKLAQEVSIHVIPVEEIDAAVISETSNLNDLEAKHFTDIINTLKPDKAIIDCPSPNIPAYHQQISKKLTCTTDLSCEHKADFNHTIVAAASILAKVTRDREVDKLQKELGIDFGSGYLTDEKTQDFLKKHWKNHPHAFRKTWAPYKALVEATKQKSLGEFETPAKKKSRSKEAKQSETPEEQA